MSCSWQFVYMAGCPRNFRRQVTATETYNAVYLSTTHIVKFIGMCRWCVPGPIEGPGDEVRSLRNGQTLCGGGIGFMFVNIALIQGSRRGRFGARSKYVDVLNPGGSGKDSNSQAPPPPAPVGLSVPLGGASQPPFSGNFFVPQPIPGKCAEVGT